MPAISEVFNQPGALFVLLPAGRKAPPIEKDWPNKPHSYDEACQHVKNGGNIGIITGGGYITLDQDNSAAFDGLNLPATTRWQTRPGRCALWFKVEGNVAAALEHIGKKPELAQIYLSKNGNPCGELKLQKSFQLIPPSWKVVDGAHTDYVFIDELPPATINIADLLAILQEGGISLENKKSRLNENAAKLEALGKEQQQKRVAAAIAEQKGAPEWMAAMEQAASSKATRERAYCEAALKKELDELSTTAQGNRNNRLNVAAFNLGQLIAPGQLEEAEVVSALHDMARQIGLEEGEIEGTIRSGITSGRSNPREIPKPENESVIASYDEIVDVKVDQAGNVRTARLMPTRAAEVILSRMPLAMDADSEDIYYFNGQIYLPDGARKIDIELCKVAKDLVTADKLKGSASEDQEYAQGRSL